MLTGAAVALGIGVILGTQLTLARLDDQGRAVGAERAGASALDVRATGATGLSAGQTRAITGSPGVAGAAPLLEKRVTARLAATDVAGTTVVLIGVDQGSAALRPVHLDSGALPASGSPSEVAIDSGLAAALRHPPAPPLRLHDRILLTTATGPDTYTITGFTSATAGGAAFTRSAVFLTSKAMTTSFALGLRTPLMALRLQPGATRDNVAREISASLGGGITITDPSAVTAGSLAQIRPLLLLLTVLSVVVGAGVTANSVSLAAFERRRETALLRAAGAARHQVVTMLACEAGLIALAAAPVGIVLGLVIAGVLTAAFAAPGLPLPPTSTPVGTILVCAALGLGSALLGALLPAVAGARMSVLTALRSSPSGDRERSRPAVTATGAGMLVLGTAGLTFGGPALVAAGAVAFLAGVVLLLPLLTPMITGGLAMVLSPLAGEAEQAAAGLNRRRNRSALAIGGLAASVAAAVAAASLSAATMAAGDAWISGLLIGDHVVRSPVTEPDAVAASLARAVGVRAVTPVRFFALPLSGSVVGVATIDPAAYARLGGLDVSSPDRAGALRALETGPSLLVPKDLAAATGWSVGRRMLVDTVAGPTTFRVAGLVAHSFPSGDGRESALMGRAIAAHYFGAESGGFDDLEVVVAGDPTPLQNAAAGFGLQTVSVDDIRSSARQALQHGIGLLVAVAAVTVAIAMLAVVNTLMVTIRHGNRDLALLRAAGLSSRQGFSLILAEAGLLAMSGALVGVGSGLLLAFPLLRASARPEFAPGYMVPLTTIGLIVVAILIATLAATWGPARRAAATRIVSTIRYE